jgi:ubiquinone/menaquinone biosynthesis C-methylase UbiE
MAPSARSFTGIDLTGPAIAATRERFRALALDSSRLIQMDAERLDFPDASFDFVWSWGAVHHSAYTKKIMEEIRRVLRPGGRAVTMVYHLNWWNWRVLGGLFHGMLRGRFRQHRSIHAIIQEVSDSGLAWYYTADEWRAMVAPLFARCDFRILGSKAELIPIPGGRVQSLVLRAIPGGVARFFGTKLHMGRFLVAEMHL